ncbi:MAG: cbb3-type cytochrome c oxidase subunit 3 [Gammaproteobacteria bacterium]|nr:cbb3-type cytochrome c oxidase subunit 3 [Gammaproteobacteria bacterium]
MDELFTWLGYFLAPVFLILLIAWVYRPSARRKYREAKNIPFADDAPSTRGKDR